MTGFFNKEDRSRVKTRYMTVKGEFRYAALPLAERVARLRDPDFRARLLATPPIAEPGFARSTLQNWANMFRMDEAFDYEPLQSASLQAVADRQNASAPARIPRRSKPGSVTYSPAQTPIGGNPSSTKSSRR